MKKYASDLRNHITNKLNTQNAVLIVGVGLLLGFAVIAGYRPDLLPRAFATPLREAIQSSGGATILLVIGGILLVIAIVGSWLWRAESGPSMESAEAVETTSRNVPVSGDSVTQQFIHQRTNPEDATTPIEDTLRATVADLYAQSKSQQEATRYIDSGDWTAHQVAAASLTTTEAVDFPLWFRIFAWVSPGYAYSYRMQVTLQAVETAFAEKVPTFTAPEHPETRIGQARTVFSSDERGEQQ